MRRMLPVQWSNSCCGFCPCCHIQTCAFDHTDGKGASFKCVNCGEEILPIKGGIADLYTVAEWHGIVSGDRPTRAS